MNPSDEVLRGGYISTSLDPPAAMFQRTSIPIPFTGTVTHLRVCSGFLIYVMVNREMKVIRRANMASKTDEKDDIEFRDDDVENIYMDPTGDHVIISMASESNYYLHRLSKSLKILSKFSGHIISAVAWNDECALRYTGPLLVGTKKGLVFETSLVASEEGKFRIASSAAEQYAKQLYDIGDFTVSGLAYGRVTTGQQKRRLQSHNIFILLVTSGRLYQFFGTVGSTLEGHSVFQSIFEATKTYKK
ncbi:VPS18 [Bugula neritina]|uniref:VPS18 n=1 Tax=Bugula neritina TaxID=10212 RepID=A0A7J7K3L7_BUGNE|nr:VPS18 [Bugula neritina]